MSTNAFDVLMRKVRPPVCPPDDPRVTAVIYEAHLEHVDPEEPLFRVPYFGQVVRAGMAEENFEARKRAHETNTIRDPKDLGFHAVIGMFGADTIEWRIVSSKSGRRSEAQAWANAEEISLIDEHGGVLRNMDARLKQTLNLTKGGQGDPAAVWAGIEARRRRAFTKFKAAMEAYVEEHGSALVPQAYVDEDGCKLGFQLANFRSGQMRKGMSDRVNIDAWAEALPKWAWDATKTDEYKANRVQAGKDKWDNASDDKRAEWCKANKDAQNRPEVRAKRSQNHKDWWTNATEKQKADRAAKRKATIATAESKAKRSKSSKEWLANEPAEQKADRIAKQNATKATAVSKAKRSKSAKDQRANELRAELERARAIAVPFVKSKKRRKEMRAASTYFLGKWGNAVLYMISEDGKTIRRVNTEGLMGEVQIVGPVVDPAPPDAFDSD